MTALDADAVARRILALNEALEDLARPEAGDARALSRDRLLRAAVERWVQVAVEACIDVASHVVAAHGWTPPETGRGALATLAAHGRIDAELAERLGKAAGLRNVLVHEYVAVEIDTLARAVREDLGDLRAFAAAAAGWIAEHA